VVGAGSVGAVGYQEYKTFHEELRLSYSSIETDGPRWDQSKNPRDLPMRTRIKYHIMDFAARHGVPVQKGNERILAKINSSNRQERNESINFLAKGTEWMDGSV